VLASALLQGCGGAATSIAETTTAAPGTTAQGAQTLAGVGSLPESYVLNKVMTGGGAMPSFGDWLDQAEIDAIVAYVRTSF